MPWTTTRARSAWSSTARSLPNTDGRAGTPDPSLHAQPTTTATALGAVGAPGLPCEALAESLCQVVFGDPVEVVPCVAGGDISITIERVVEVDP